ncbi:dCTP pyrophosphatase 1-like [Stegodyphus dumicola]|uniref:dCTP pyrophosphatase 1-like n=1 Tax=Stegodyphus dumicola TaxID=202533 RepID=UPI0015A7FD47|nr:dCTP pyrophosphatase 1-like [Stegodyphus dumicola]
MDAVKAEGDKLNTETSESNNVIHCELKPEMSKDYFRFSDKITFEDIRILQEHFVEERNWNQYHVPRNLLLALVGEVGELAELFQWRGEVKEGLPDWTENEKEHLAQELSDVLLYLLRLSEKCRIDLPAAVLDKIGLNAKKYPVTKVWGSNKKYTEYKES